MHQKRFLVEDVEAAAHRIGDDINEASVHFVENSLLIQIADIDKEP